MSTFKAQYDLDLKSKGVSLYVGTIPSHLNLIVMVLFNPIITTNHIDEYFTSIV